MKELNTSREIVKSASNADEIFTLKKVVEGCEHRSKIISNMDTHSQTAVVLKSMNDDLLRYAKSRLKKINQQE